MQENIPAITGISDTSKARLVYYRPGITPPFAHGPADGAGYQSLEATLTAIAGLSPTADTAIYFTGADVAALFTLTAAGRALLDDANAAAQRTTLGVTATGADTTYAFRANNLSDLASVATAFANIKQAATTSATGVVELATDAEALAGTDTTRAITPSNLGAIPGTWTPTLFNTTNVAASVASLCQYIRIGNRVMCWGIFTVDPTAAANTVLGISLPIPSNLGASTDCFGIANAQTAQRGGRIGADTTNDRAMLTFVAETDANVGFGFTFSYNII